MGHPFLLVGFLLAKKAAGFAIYRALKDYGVSRAYRRVLEADRRLNKGNKAVRQTVRSVARTAFVYPGKAAELIENSEVTKFILEMAKELRQHKGTQWVEGMLMELLTSRRGAAAFFSEIQKYADSEKEKATGAGAGAGPGITKGGPGAEPRMR